MFVKLLNLNLTFPKCIQLSSFNMFLKYLKMHLEHAQKQQ
jgi:hypothetical protein